MHIVEMEISKKGNIHCTLLYSLLDFLSTLNTLKIHKDFTCLQKHARPEYTVL